MDEIIRKRIREWTSPPYDPGTISEITALVGKGDEKELTERFYTTLEFGTGGLRGIIGAGTNRMNIYTVGAAAQGMADYILSQNRRDDGVVIAYDSRNFSDRFAVETASVMAASGIRVFLFDELTPVPICSFAIRELGAAAGVVITASHNPPEYNGFKAYWDDGAQVVPPHDRAIIERVSLVDTIAKIRKIDFQEGVARGAIAIIGPDIRKRYREELSKRAFRAKKPSALKIAYTPLHGSGTRMVPEVLAHFGFTGVSIVESQKKPDGAFPTVKYPNPEEKDAMELCLALARDIDADIVLATDPDADRMGVGFRDGSGEYMLITGNQIGAMLEYYILTRLRENNAIPAGGTVVKTIVTTDLQDEIARSFGCGVDNVLTGFKWIAMKMREYETAGKNTYVFGGEESYGYLAVDFVRDKDAVSSCYFFAEMADWLREKGRTLFNFLNEIYSSYALYVDDLMSMTMKGIEGMGKIGAIMRHYRETRPRIMGGIGVARIADIRERRVYDLDAGGEEPATDLPQSDVLQFFLKDGSKVTMRPSGTEPKIKFYFSARRALEGASVEHARGELKGRIEALKKDIVDTVQSLG